MIWSLAIVIGSAAIALDSSGTLLRLFPRAAFVFSPYVLEFVAGCFIGLASLRVRFAAGRTSVSVAIALFTLLALVFQAVQFDGNNRSGLRILLLALPSILLVYGLLALEQKAGSLPVPRWTIRCGDISYSIYLVHLLVLHFAYRYVWQLFNHSGTRPLFMVAATCLAIVASVIFYKLVERPFSVWTRMRLEDIFKVKTKKAVTPAPAPAESTS
jgi:peptidoglycan/LPS O-acetylase OafA/YrhL